MVSNDRGRGDSWEMGSLLDGVQLQCIPVKGI